MFACEKGHTKIVGILLQKYADDYNCTAFHYVFISGHSMILDIIKQNSIENSISRHMRVNPSGWLS